jgi:hypothetical protein
MTNRSHHETEPANTIGERLASVVDQTMAAIDAAMRRSQTSVQLCSYHEDKIQTVHDLFEGHTLLERFVTEGLGTASAVVFNEVTGELSITKSCKCAAVSQAKL